MVKEDRKHCQLIRRHRALSGEGVNQAEISNPLQAADWGREGPFFILFAFFFYPLPLTCR